MSRTLLLILINALLVPLCSCATSLDLYPFGQQHGHQAMPRNDDGSSPEISFNGTEFPFSNTRYKSLYVNTNGLISFNRSISQYEPDPFPLVNDSRVMIAPFWADVDIGNGGEIWYAAVTSQDILQRASQDVRDAFPASSGFTAAWTFVATWYKVPYYGSTSYQSNTNTFQVILITDGRHSFVRFVYQEITWTQSSSGGGKHAECGVNAGSGSFSYSITKSGNVSLFDLPYKTNLKNPKAGVWMFRLDENKTEASGATKEAPKVECDTKYMNVEIPKSQYPNINWRNFHLSDANCRATTETLYLIRLSAPLNGCGTNYTETNDMLMFWNMVKIDNRYPNPTQSMITREGTTVMQFYCRYSRRQLVSTSFSPAKETVHVSEGNFGNFTFSMHMFKSSTFTSKYLPFEYPVKVTLNQPLWIQLRVTTDNLVVFAETCHATTSVKPNSSPSYKFLENGCVLDTTMVYNYNRLSSTQTFSIKSFRFIQGNNLLIYIHCELMACHLFSNNSRCARGCIKSVSARRRRDVAQQFEDTTNEYSISTGPVQMSETSKQDAQTNDGVSGLVIGIGVLGALLLGICAVVVIMMTLKLYKSRRVEPAPNGNAYDGPAATQPDAESNVLEAGKLKV